MCSSKCEHIRMTNPSIISRVIHCTGIHTEWMHSSHNYHGGSHTLHQSIPVSKSLRENSECIWFLKDIMRFLYLHLRKVKRAEHDLLSVKVTSWLIHTSTLRLSSWRRIIQRSRMLEWSKGDKSLKKKNLYHTRKYLQKYNCLSHKGR